MKCGNCKEEGPHVSVDHVRACYQGKTTADIQADRLNNAAAERITDGFVTKSNKEQRPQFYGRGRPLPFPAGRYAIDPVNPSQKQQTHFYRIDAPEDGKWAGYVFVKEQAGDELHPVKGMSATIIIDAIVEAGPEAAMLRYGKELGSCGHCGRTLTDAESRAYGIGPVCRGKVSF